MLARTDAKKIEVGKPFAFPENSPDRWSLQGDLLSLSSSEEIFCIIIGLPLPGLCHGKIRYQIWHSAEIIGNLNAFDELYVQSRVFRAGNVSWLYSLHSYSFLSARVTYRLNSSFYPFLGYSITGIFAWPIEITSQGPKYNRYGSPSLTLKLGRLFLGSPSGESRVAFSGEYLFTEQARYLIMLLAPWWFAGNCNQRGGLVESLIQPVQLIFARGEDESWKEQQWSEKQTYNWN